MIGVSTLGKVKSLGGYIFCSSDLALGSITHIVISSSSNLLASHSEII